MRLFDKRTPLQKEWDKLEVQEQRFLQKRLEKKESILNQKLEEKIPPKLQGTLDAAFAKAFALIFEKGTGIIEKTYQREKLEQDYQVRQYTADVKQDSKSLRAFSKKSERYRNKEFTAIRRIRDWDGSTGNWSAGYSSIYRDDTEEYLRDCPALWI